MPRKIDALSLMSMSDAFFARIFHARSELVPFGTVSLTTYFHADLRKTSRPKTSRRVLAVADAKIFHQQLWRPDTANCGRPSGRLLATTTQIAYFKA